MTPERKATINGHEVHEYYWAGSMIVYVDHVLQEGRGFDIVCSELREEASVREDDGDNAWYHDPDMGDQ